MGTTALIIRKGADGGEFKAEVEFLTSIINPLRDSVSSAKSVSKEAFKDGIAGRFRWQGHITGSDEVTEAAHEFMRKWADGLRLIHDDADTIADNLQAAVNDYLATESQIKYDMLMAQRAKDAEDATPVTSWTRDHVIKPLGLDQLPSPPSLGQVTKGWFD